MCLLQVLLAVGMHAHPVTREHARLISKPPSLRPLSQGFAVASAAAVGSLLEYETRCAAVISGMRARLAHLRSSQTLRSAAAGEDDDPPSGAAQDSGAAAAAAGAAEPARVPANEAVVPFESLQFCVRDFVECATRCGDAVWCADIREMAASQGAWWHDAPRHRRLAMPFPVATCNAAHHMLAPERPSRSPRAAPCISSQRAATTPPTRTGRGRRGERTCGG